MHRLPHYCTLAPTLSSHLWLVYFHLKDRACVFVWSLLTILNNEKDQGQKQEMDGIMFFSKNEFKKA